MDPIRGRDGEYAELERLITTAAEGAGGVVVVEGAPGIGKSRLLAAAHGRATQLGLTVAVGAADELDRVTPWRAIEQALVSPDPALLDNGALAELRDLSDQRMAVIEHIRVILEKASEEQPLLIAVDDLQWADPATLLALSSLPRQLFSHPIAWLLARRPTPNNHVLDGLVRRLNDDGATRLHLPPLDSEASLAVARDTAGKTPGSDLSALIGGAQGNPFYIIELVKAHLLTGSSGPEPPPTVRSSVTRHLRSLSEDSRHLLSIASILGRDFSVTELAATTGQPAGRLLPAVEEAIAAEVLIEQTDRLAFRHNLLRLSVYAALPASLRAALHREAAEALRRTGAPMVRVAGHLAVSARRGDSQAVSAINEAVAQLLYTSPDAAADLAVKALALLGEQDQRRPEMLLTAIRALVLVGRRSEAVRISESHLTTWSPPARLEAAIELELRQGWILEHLQAYPTPFPAHLADDLSVDPAVIATAAACDQNIWEGQGDEADRVFSKAMRLGAEAGRSFEFTTLAYLQLLNCMLRGRMTDALSRAEGSLETARQLEVPRTTGAHETMVAAALGANGRFHESLEMLHSAVAATETSGRRYFGVQGRWLRAMHLLAWGRLDDARAEAHNAVATAEEYGYTVHRSHGLAVLVETAVRQADAKAERAAMAGFGTLDEARPLPDRFWASAVSAAAHDDLGTLAQAVLPLVEQLERGCFVVAVSQHHRLPELAHMARRLGDHTSALTIATAAEALAGLNPHVHSMAAAAAHAQGIARDDVELLHQAVAEAGQGEARLALAAAHRDLGRMLGERGSRDEARRHLGHAFEIYRAMGAQHDLTRVRAEMRQFGIRKRSTAARPTQGWDSLTRAERAVVMIVAQGLTNRQAANELCLSSDTVNTHLRHAFVKLGIRSRIELARLIHEQEN